MKLNKTHPGNGQLPTKSGVSGRGTRDATIRIGKTHQENRTTPGSQCLQPAATIWMQSGRISAEPSEATRRREIV